PLSVWKRRRDDVLRRLVHERRAGIFLSGPSRPGRGEQLVRVAPHQQRLARVHDRSDSGAHLWIERVLPRPSWIVDDAVKRHEFVYDDPSHGDPPLALGRISPKPGVAPEAVDPGLDSGLMKRR